MSENQAEVDALLAEVNALAAEAVHEIGDAGVAGGEAASHASADPAPSVGVPHSNQRASAPPRGSNIERVLHLEVPVIVRLAERSMPLSEILNLTSGAIIEFEKPADGELDLMINNKCVGQGMAVKVGENFGLRVSNIGSVQDRIKALAG